MIPIVNKTPYRAVKLIPLPVDIGSNTLVIAQTKDLVLTNKNGYIITNSKEIHEIEKGKFIIKETLPVWTDKSSNCELEAYRGNVDMIFKNCNFVKLGMTDGMHVTVTPPNRILYLTEKTQVALNCPDGRIKSELVGLHSVSDKCDITTKLLNWQAEQSKHIEVEQILQELPEAYDITELPIIELNSTSEIHESIKELINKLPKDTNTSKFIIDDWSLEEIQSYSVLTQGITIAFMVLHAIVTAILVILKCRENKRIPKITRKNESYSTFKRRIE